MTNQRTVNNEWEPEFETLLSNFNKRLRLKAKFLAQSGGINQDSYRTPMQFARVLLGAAIEDAAPLVIPFPTKEELSDLNNLQHF